MYIVRAYPVIECIETCLPRVVHTVLYSAPSHESKLILLYLPSESKDMQLARSSDPHEISASSFSCPVVAAAGKAK